MHEHDPLRQKWLAHFDALIAEAQDIGQKGHRVEGSPGATALYTGEIMGRTPGYVKVDAVEFAAWKEKCIALLNRIIPKDNPSYKLVKDLQLTYFPSSSLSLLQTLAARLSAVGDSFRAGLLDDLSAKVGAESAVDHMAQLKTLSQEQSGSVSLPRQNDAGAPKKRTRRNTPGGTEAAVLVNSKRRCCLCYGLSGDDSQKHGQVAHIDRDPSNTDVRNLVYLCLKHHDQYDTRTSQSKGLTPDELRYYGDALYADLGKRRKRRSGNHPDGSIGASKEIGGSVDARGGSHIVGDNNVVVGRDLNINNRKIQRTQVLAGPDCIVDADALKIRMLIDALVAIERTAGQKDTHSKWYTKLYRHFKVTSYKLIPASRAIEAIEWLQRQKAINRPKLRRRDNDEWRNSLYKGIWARAKQRGMQKADVYNLALERLNLQKPICSLKEIGERDLEKLNQIIMRIWH